HGTKFRYISTATQFGIFLPINFLCLLSTSPKVLPTGIELSVEDSERFKTLSSGLDKLNRAMKLLHKRHK
ncbi:hypothetical protein C8F04DRAFT_918963, partial [Mycena alexandri]